jgi:hypothetical protein
MTARLLPVDPLAERRSLEQAELGVLAEHFKTGLEVLQQPQAREKLTRVLASKGRARKAPSAGKDF